MTHIFISYSKKDIVFARYVRGWLQSNGFTVWIDETRLSPSERWWPMIERNIRSCSAFLVIMSPDAQESDWVEREILLVERLKKPLFPILLDGEAWARLGNIQYEDMTAGVNATPSSAFIERLKDFAPTFSGVTAPPPLPGSTITDTAIKPIVSELTDQVSSGRKRILGLALVTGIVVIFLVAFGGVAAWLAAHPTPTALPTRIAQVTTALAVPATLPASVTRAIATSTPLPTRTSTPSVVPTTALPLSGIDLARTLRAQGLTQTVTLWTGTPTNTATPTANETAIINSNLTLLAATDTEQANLNQTATATLWTPTITPTFTPSDTPTLTPTFTATNTPIPAVTSNGQWAPVIKLFDNVPMALVPPGCFIMGSSDIKDALPGKFCVTYPFWIDEYLVTQSQFKAFNGQAANSSYFTGSRRPVDSITWGEAQAYCEQIRGGRLPTEVEYEYAARGPDSLIYPWGNTFNVNNVVFSGNSNGQTVDVGSKADGKSWVGALDMVGDVWEWTSSLYKPYPYDPTDGRENLSDAKGARVLRGGSWKVASDLRPALRQVNNPTDGYPDDGMRCARAFS